MMHFCLVTMPYARIELSSVAVGLLQAELKRAGLEARSVYANILFGEKIGSEAYTNISLFRPRLAIADWTFAHIAFPKYEPDHSGYFDLVLDMQETYAPWHRDKFETLLWDVRQKATDFTKDLVTEILALHPKIVGCSSTFCQHVPSLALLRALKEEEPEVVTVMGGANCETIMGKATHEFFPWVDYVVSGEADGLIVELTRAILSHGTDAPPDELPVGVFGPVHRHAGYPVRQDGSFHGVPRAMTMSLDDSPVPDYDDFVRTVKSATAIGDHILPGITVESSRGCWWGQRRGCVFCGFNGKGMRFRSKNPQKFVDELAALWRRYEIDGIEAVDNILDMNYLKTALPMITAAGSPYRLYYEIKSNFQRRQVKILRDAGVIWVQTGIESLNTHILDLMNKGCKAWQNIQVLKWLREFGIRVHWNMLFDFPGDQDEWYLEMADMIPLLTHLQPPIKMVPLEFCRYSVYHENQGTYGLKLRASSPFRYVYPVGEDELDSLVYFFEDEERIRSERNPILAFLTEREAFKILRKQYDAWRVLFWRSGARLAMTLTDDEALIEDTRPAAVHSSYRLTGLKRDVYLDADKAPIKENLISRFSGPSTPISEVESICKEFLSNKIAVEIDGRFVALAVRGPLPDLPTAFQYPGGVLLPDGSDRLCRQAADER